MRILIDHLTSYRYERPASGIVQRIRLSPRPLESQQIRAWHIDFDADGRLIESSDSHGNIIHMFYAERPLESLTIHVSGDVTTFETSGVIGQTDERLPLGVYRRATDLTPADGAIRTFAEGCRADTPLAEGHRLMLAIHERITFDVAATEPATDAASAFALGRGVCQDLTQIFLAAARHLGHASRYVQGHYAASEQPEQEAAHAWAELWVPHLGWVTFDPTHGISAGEGHVRVAVGLDALDAAPVRGARRGGGTESLEVKVHGRQAVEGHLAGEQWQGQG
ncbi:MAG: transglutaminase domain-containing protein [Thermaurantiacus sp.]